MAAAVRDDLWYLPATDGPQPLCLPEAEHHAYALGHLSGGMFRVAEEKYDAEQRAMLEERKR